MASRTRTYSERPPVTARAARVAWDYFMAHHFGGKRKIVELFYSANIEYSYRGWVCVFEILDGDTDNWKFGIDNVTFTAGVWAIENWERERRG